MGGAASDLKVTRQTQETATVGPRVLLQGKGQEEDGRQGWACCSGVSETRHQRATGHSYQTRSQAFSLEGKRLERQSRDQTGQRPDCAVPLASAQAGPKFGVVTIKPAVSKGFPYGHPWTTLSLIFQS